MLRELFSPFINIGVEFSVGERQTGSGWAGAEMAKGSGTCLTPCIPILTSRLASLSRTVGQQRTEHLGMKWVVSPFHVYLALLSLEKKLMPEIIDQMNQSEYFSIR
jgi:hypothetical protein